MEGQNPKPAEESYEQWEDETVADDTYKDMPQQPLQPVRPVPMPMRTGTEGQYLPQTISDEEMVERMQEEVDKRKEMIRKKKEDEEEQRKIMEMQQQPQRQMQQPIYLSEAEMLREINRKVDALVVWAVDVNNLLKLRRE